MSALTGEDWPEEVFPSKKKSQHERSTGRQRIWEGNETSLYRKGGGRKGAKKHRDGARKIEIKDWIRLQRREIVKAIEDQAKKGQNIEDITVISLRPTSIWNTERNWELRKALPGAHKNGTHKVGWQGCTVRERIAQKMLQVPRKWDIKEKTSLGRRTGDCLRVRKGGTRERLPKEGEFSQL
ncbi:hypothetical protein JTB14_031144 [Gonioctena quinquepunctata]|nr:hypothetical protein JTB14_031144 [Gonioctena quinquepunctata]